MDPICDQITHLDRADLLASLRIDVTGTKFLRTLGGFGYANWAKFKELSYGDSYSYRVWNDDRSSDWYSFTMQPDSTDHFSFVFIGDVQDTLRGKTRGFMENVRHRYSSTGGSINMVNSRGYIRKLTSDAVLLTILSILQ